MKKSTWFWLCMLALAAGCVLVMAMKPLGNVGAVLAFFLLAAVVVCGVIRFLRGKHPKDTQATDQQILVLQKENTLHGKPWK